MHTSANKCFFILYEMKLVSLHAAHSGPDIINACQTKSTSDVLFRNKIAANA